MASISTPHQRASSLSAPAQPSERFVHVDVLRGFAVFGILVANIASYSGEPGFNALSEPLGRWIVAARWFLIQAKFYSLFSFLFGWGLAIQMRRAEARQTNFVSVYIRRLIVLLIFGLVHAGLIWSGDILTLYALLGFVLLLLRRLPPRWLIGLSLLGLLMAVILVLPGAVMDQFRESYEAATSFLRSSELNEQLYASGDYWTITRLRWQDFTNGNSWVLYFLGNVFSMFLLGLYIGRREILARYTDHLPLVWTIWLIGLVLGGVGNGVFAYTNWNPGWVPAEYTRLVAVVSRTIGAPAFMAFYAASILLLYRSTYWRSRLEPLAAVGRMALSNYIFQSLFATLLFYGYGLGLYGETGPVFGLILVVILYLFQIRLSQAWLENHNYGPLEWLWRILTYGRITAPSEGERGGTITWWDRFRPARWRVPPLILLAFVWLLLIGWGAGLLAWRDNIQARTGEPLTVFVRVTATPGSGRPGQLQQVPVVEESAELTLAQADPMPERSLGRVVRKVDTESLAAVFDEQQVVNTIDILTGPPYLGRETGSPQAAAAAEFIAAQFARAGLRPIGEAGSYYQEFPVFYTPLLASPELQVDPAGPDDWASFQVYRDFSPVLGNYAGSGLGEGSIIWMDDCGPEDFLNRDVVGEIVLCRLPGSHQGLVEVARRSIEHAASGLLILTDPQERPADFRTVARESWVPQTIPVLRVYPRVIAAILAGSGLNQDDLLKLGRAQSLNSRARVLVEASVGETCPGPACTGRNVLGVLPGWDPAYANEVIILGAHYDHMGQSPDGTVWSGANDNASGVAVMLEIARSWAAAGYQPRRTVLFAAWDAEEPGLLGSYHYAAHPIFPLDHTLAMIQFDMVGAPTEVLSVSGQDDLAAHLVRLAQARQVPVEQANMGRSDHTPFLEAGVPASLLIWYEPEAVAPHYHRPADTLDVIDPQALKSVGELAAQAVLDLVENEPAINDLLASRSRAISQLDRAAYLGTSTGPQQAAESAWFESLGNLDISAVEIEPKSLRLSGDQAEARIAISIDYLEPGLDPPTQTLSAEMLARLTQTSAGWRWDGPALEAVPGYGPREDGIDIQVWASPERVASLSDLSETAARRYAAAAELLDLPPQVTAKIEILPSASDLRASTNLNLPDEQQSWVIPEQIRLVDRPNITTTAILETSLVQLLLAESGVAQPAAPWLWEGLPLLLAEKADIAQTQQHLLPALQRYLEQPGLELSSQAADWASVFYLHNRLGWSGLGDLIREIGAHCRIYVCSNPEQIQPVLLHTLDGADFDSQWRTYWQTKFAAAQNELDQLLRWRQAALEIGDQDAFLATVDETVPHLFAEQSHWFEKAQSGAEVVDRAEIQVLYPDGRVLAELFTDGGQPGINVIFTPSDEGLHWAGTPLALLAGNHVSVGYPTGGDELAAVLLPAAESAYLELAEALGLESIPDQLIQLYPTAMEFNSSISPRNDTLNYAQSGWTDRGEAIKLLVKPGAQPDSYLPSMVKLQARQLLLGMGLKDPWLLQGISLYLQTNLGEAGDESPAQALPALAAIISPEQAGDMTAIPPYPHADSAARSKAWDSVRYLINTYGWEALQTVMNAHSQGQSVDRALQAGIGRSRTEFEREWLASLARGHADPEWTMLANRINFESAQAHLLELTSPQLAGRQAGTEGESRAAVYIASQMQAFGLLPVPIQDIPESEAVLNRTGEYLHTFPISYTAVTAGPYLELKEAPGLDVPQEFAHRVDFLARWPAVGARGQVEGELIWTLEDLSSDLDVEGRIVIMPAGTAPQELSQRGAELGARAVLVFGSLHTPEQLLAKRPLNPAILDSEIGGVPVLELTQSGYERLLEQLGYTRRSIRALPAGSVIAARVKLGYSRSLPEPATSANVIGWLPGSDPVLRREVIVLGAHYDHVGDDPGYRFSGANDNASGVAVMLEIARLWQEIGYQPKRSIVFAAWGAQELGELGSRDYIAHPVLPLAHTVAMVQLDGVGGGDGFNFGVEATWEHDGTPLFAVQSAGELLSEKLTIVTPYNQSDQVPFREQGIPAVLISWRLANETNLADQVSPKVLPERLGQAGSLVSLALMTLAQ